MCEASEGKIHSGCTAVTAFLRVEDADGSQSFLDSSAMVESPDGNDTAVTECSSDGHEVESSEENPKQTRKHKKSSSSARKFRKALHTLSGSFISPTPPPSDDAKSGDKDNGTTEVKIIDPPTASRRVLYTANAGDARGVLCRGGKAVRLTYDHKGSDKQEAKRITDAGGFVMSGRVNGVLAVTRSLGDSSMKEFVVGAPYTTETELCDEDELLILACDGVRCSVCSVLSFFVLTVFLCISEPLALGRRWRPSCY